MTADVLPLRQGAQPRERAVACARCRRETWNTSAICDRCIPLVEAERQRERGLPSHPSTHRQTVDEALCDYAVAVAGTRSADAFHVAVLDRLDSVTGRLATRTAAAFWAAALTAGDTLASKLDALEAAFVDVETDAQQPHEDTACRTWRDDACLICRSENTAALHAALQDVKALLGEGALRDMNAAVA